MNYNKLNSIVRKFLMNESTAPSVYSRLNSLSALLNEFNPKSQRDLKKLDTAKYELREIKRNVRKLHERIQILEEQVHVLEENKNEK